MSESLIKNVVYKFLLILFKVVSPMLIIPFVYRQISVSDMGELNFIVAFMTYFYIVGDLGLYVYGMREASRLKNNPLALNRFFTQTFILRFITNSIAILLYLVTVEIYFHGIPDSLYLIVLINMISTYFKVEGIFEALEQFRFITVKTIIVRLISFVLIYIYVRGDSAKFYYLYISGGFLLANNLVSFIFIQRKIKFNFSEFQLRKHLAPQFYIFLMINATVLFLQLDKTFLGMHSLNEDVGYYSLCEKLVLIVSGFVLTITQVTTPRLVSYGKSREYINLLRKSTRVLSFLIFPLATGTIVLSDEIVALFGGQEYQEIGYLLRLFSSYILIFTLLEILKTQIMLVAGKERQFVLFLFLGGILNIALKIFLGPVLNAEIAILTSLLSLSVTVILLLIYTYRILNVSFVSVSCGRYILFALPILGVYYLQIDHLIYGTLIKTAIGTAIYFGLLLISRDLILKEIIENIKRKFLK